MTLLEQAIKFRKAFGQPINEGFAPNGFINQREFAMQMRLVEEEVKELEGAAVDLLKAPNDLGLQTAFLKELSDTAFVVYQLAACYGLDLDTAMERVFISNMSKLGDDGVPIYREDGKVLKSENYKKPRLDDLITVSHRTYDTSGK